MATTESTSTEDALELAAELTGNACLGPCDCWTCATERDAADALRPIAHERDAVVAERDEWQAACVRAQENVDHWTAEAARYAAESRALAAERDALREALGRIACHGIRRQKIAQAALAILTHPNSSVEEKP